MRIPNRYLKAFKIWLDGHIKAGRLVPSKSHISSGTFLRPNQGRMEEPVYNAGDKVMLDCRNLRKRLKKDGKPAKFYPRYLRLFRIIKAKRETSNYNPGFKEGGV